jgi:hypothetical protein
VLNGTFLFCRNFVFSGIRWWNFCTAPAKKLHSGTAHIKYRTFLELWKCTDEKENQIFLIYKEIQKGLVAKSYMTNGLLIFGYIFARYLIYDFAPDPIWISIYMRKISFFFHLWLCNRSHLNFHIYEKNLIFLFISYAQ